MFSGAGHEARLLRDQSFDELSVLVSNPDRAIELGLAGKQ
jgi:hypothetical protein